MNADPYDAFAADYHWFFDDTALHLGSDVPGVRAAIAGLAPEARVLDVACGIGVDAAALAVRGFDVTATDASAQMITEARARLDAQPGGTKVPTHEMRWDRLASRVGADQFDAVFCTGGSIAHASNAEEMINALDAFLTVLVPGGVLVLDTPDWELVHANGSRMLVEPRVFERNGLRCVRSYAWHLPDDFGPPCVFEVGAILLDGERVELRSHSITMHPFTRPELKRRLDEAGFTGIALDVIPGDDRYTAIARKPA